MNVYRVQNIVKQEYLICSFLNLESFHDTLLVIKFKDNQVVSTKICSRLRRILGQSNLRRELIDHQV